MKLTWESASRLGGGGICALTSVVTIGNSIQTQPCFNSSIDSVKVSFDSLFKHLSVDNILKVFGAVLLERHVIFTAQHLR